jgi:hypothetical protein
MSAVAPTYDEINRQACPYPGNLLPEAGTGLALFAAGFLGHNDVIHMARKEMQVTCVDVNADKLWEMAEIYPEGWEFHADDAWEFAERAVLAGRTFDVVSIDPFFGDAAEQAWETMFLWVTLARELVTLTVKTDTKLNIPSGWTADFFPRSSAAAWLVLTR